MSVSYLELILIGCILILPFLYETNQAFRYYFKFFLYYGYVMFNSVLLLPYFALRPRSVKNLLTASYWCRPLSTLIGITWIVKGKEHLEKDRPCIVVSNHQSSLDVLGMFDFWYVMDKCTVIAKKELFYAWPFGLAAWLGGLVYIPRVNDTQKAAVIMNEAAENIKNNKIKLWVFPEGTRRNTGEIHRFKKGAFHLAISTKLPIIPVVFSRYYFLDKNAKRFDNGKVFVTALPPISTENLTNENLDQLINDTRNKMIEVFEQSNKELSIMLSSTIKS